MSKTIDFYYDYVSATSYLAWTQLQGLCERTGASINYKPILLGGVFKASENISPMTIPAKWEWFKKDLERHAAHYGVPYQLNSHFPFSSVNALRGAFWAQANDRIEDYNRAMFTAAWADGKNLSSMEALEEILTAASFDAAEAMKAMTLPENKSALMEATNAAAEQGVFGAPTMVIDGELHFGQDRLEWVERALS